MGRIAERLAEIRSKYPSSDLWMEDFLLLIPEDPYPYIYYIPEDWEQIRVEWSIGNWEASLEIPFGSHTGEYDACDMSKPDDPSIVKTLDLDNIKSWYWIINQHTLFAGRNTINVD